MDIINHWTLWWTFIGGNVTTHMYIFYTLSVFQLWMHAILNRQVLYIYICWLKGKIVLKYLNCFWKKKYTQKCQYTILCFGLLTVMWRAQLTQYTMVCHPYARWNSNYCPGTYGFLWYLYTRVKYDKKRKIVDQI